MDINESETSQMEANAYQEDHFIKSKEAEAHSLDGATQLKQQGPGNTQNTKGDIHNGEYSLGYDEVSLYINGCTEISTSSQKVAAMNWKSRDTWKKTNSTNDYL